MTMLEDRTFARNDVLPAYIINRLQDHVSNLVTGFRVRALNATTLQVIASPGTGAAGIGIQGQWRWNEATTTRSMPGGAAGTFSVFAVSAANSISNSPQPNTDNTNYAFTLAITTGAAPTIVAGTLDIYRLVATVEWDGVKITAVIPTVLNADPTLPTSPTADTTGQTPLRVRGPVGGGLTVDLAEFRDQPGGTVMAAIGSTGQARLSSVLVGGDVLVGRSAADHLSLGAGDLLDLSAAGGTDASSGSAAGDKVVLGSGIGFGVQSNRLVAYVPAGQALSIRATAGAGNKSSGTDAITLASSGVITTTGALTITGALTGATTGAFSSNVTVGGTLGVTGATTFTGIPSGPTAAANTNTTQLATTAFVTAAVTASSPTGVAYLANAQTFTGVNTFSAAGTALAVTNNVTVGGTLGVTGKATFGQATALTAGVVNLASAATAAGGIYFGTDTNLYRLAAGVLRTDGQLQAGSVRATGTGQVDIGGSTTPLITFGSAADTNLYRSAAGALKTDGTLEVGSTLTSRSDINARPLAPNTGYVGLTPGDTGNSGFVGFFAPDGLRNGYIGFSVNAEGIRYVAERGGHKFSGNIGFYGVAAIARQARPTTLNGVITALVNLGLIA